MLNFRAVTRNQVVFSNVGCWLWATIQAIGAAALTS
jgi:hypothetical protein